MAKTEFGVNHTLTNKVWAKTLMTEAFRRTFFGKFRGTGENSLLVEKTDLRKAAGDKITCGLNFQLQGEGVQGDATMEGNEESLEFYNDSLNVDQLRHGVKIGGRMTEQRVPYNLRKQARTMLGDWWAVRFDVALANHLCGNTAQTDTKYTGNNATLAPTTNRILRVNAAATDQALTASDIFSLEYVDYAREKAETASTADSTGPLVQPIMLDGEPHYVMFLHDYQATDLRLNTSTGQWLDIQKAALAGGDIASNPIFKNSLGVYNGVILHRWSRISEGVHSTAGTAVSNTRRAVFCGAGAAMLAFGGDSNDTRMNWTEKTFDYANQFGVSAGAIFGVKKCVYAPESGSANQEDYGTIVVTSYAAAHTGA